MAKKPDLNTKAGRYFLNKKKGMNKSTAIVEAGYSSPTQISKVEHSQIYQAIEKWHYKDVLMKKISLDEIADEQIKVILQDRDLGSKNKAIEMAIGKVEPEKIIESDDDRILVVIK